INAEKFTALRTAVDRAEPFVLQVGRQIFRIVVVQPTAFLVTWCPGEGGGAWILLQNKGQVDTPHGSRDGAVARARESALTLRSRAWTIDGDRVVEVPLEE